MIKRLGMLAALMVLFSAYLVAGNEGADMSNEFWVILGCVIACCGFGALWYAIANDTDNWDD